VHGRPLANTSFSWAFRLRVEVYRTGIDHRRRDLEDQQRFPLATDDVENALRRDHVVAIEVLARQTSDLRLAEDHRARARKCARDRTPDDERQINHGTENKAIEDGRHEARAPVRRHFAGCIVHVVHIRPRRGIRIGRIHPTSDLPA